MLAGLLVLPGVARALGDLQPLEPIYEVNLNTVGDQYLPRIAALDEGRVVVVWTSEGQDGDGGGVFGRLFDAAAGPVGPELQVNVYTEGSQSLPAVAPGPAGGFLVVWSSSGQDGSSSGVYARRFDASGTALGGEVQVNTYTDSYQISPWVAPAAGVGFVVVWASLGQDGDLSGIFGRLLDQDGLPAGPEFPVNLTTLGSQRQPSITAAPDGSFVVTWVHSVPPNPAGHNDAFGIRIATDGTALSPEFQINGSVPVQLQVPVAFDPAGTFLAVWCPSSLETVEDGVWGRRFGPSAAPLGPEFRIDPSQVGRNTNADVVPDGRGGFLVVWERGEGIFPVHDFEIMGLQLDPNGSAVSPEVVLGDRAIDQTMVPKVVGAGPGEFVVAWTDWEARDGDQAGAFAGRLRLPADAAVAVPALSPAGALALAVLLGAAALESLRRLRRQGPRSRS